MKTSEILDKAADVIEERGWWRGSFAESSGRNCKVCALGAMNVASGLAPDDALGPDVHKAAMALADHVGLAHEASGLGATYAVGDHWNDSRTSAEEVVRELRAAAASEREAGR